MFEFLSLSSQYADKPPQWFFFAKEETEIDFVKLHGTLKQYDPTLVWNTSHFYFVLLVTKWK